VNFARLNHIFVPATREARDRLRQSLWLRIFSPLAWFYGALSDEGRVMSVLVLFVGTAGVDVATTQVYVLWATLMGLFVAGLAVRSAYRLRGVKIHLETPRRVTAGETMRIGVVVDNRSDRAHHAVRLRGPFLPWDGRYVGATPRFGRLGPGERVRGEVRARFVQRGPHHLDPFAASALVPFGLAVGPSIESEGCRFVVLPRPARVESLAVPRGQSRAASGPLGSSGRVGSAFELVGVRPYRRGDPLRDLHPKTWARVGTPHVREYRHPRHRHTALVVDPSARTERGLEAAIALAAGAAIHLARERLDALVVGEEVHPVERQRGAIDLCLDRLAQVPPMPRVALLPDEAMARLPHLACAVIVSASDDGRAIDLAERLKRRGIGCRILRVHDGGFLRRSPPAPRHAAEEVVSARAIESQEALYL
jgi:uncharacterized protein (DUF58 family)